MLHDILVAVWFFIPAGVANIAPVLASKTPLVKHLNAPIDRGVSIGGKRLLGDNKTWRGIVAGVILSVLVLAVQQAIVTAAPGFAEQLQPLDYRTLPTLVLGALFALGALGGDAIESFFKRRLDIPSGTAWVPFDQIDYIVGAIIATAVVVQLAWHYYLWAIILWVTIHFIASYIGYLLGLKKTPV